MTPTAKVRQTVMDRAGRLCELCRARAGVIHHRRPRGSGGTSLDWVNRPANLLALCSPCHLMVESERDVSMAAGLLLPYSAVNAWSHPVELWRGRVWLDDDGNYLREVAA